MTPRLHLHPYPRLSSYFPSLHNQRLREEKPNLLWSPIQKRKLFRMVQNHTNDRLLLGLEALCLPVPVGRQGRVRRTAWSDQSVCGWLPRSRLLSSASFGNGFLAFAMRLSKFERSLLWSNSWSKSDCFDMAFSSLHKLSSKILYQQLKFSNSTNKILKLAY